MKKIMIITDNWYPEITGVAVAYAEIERTLIARGYDVRVVHPGLFWKMPFFWYPEFSLALFPGKRLRQMIDEFDPDAIHVAVSSALGFSARRILRRRKVRFTTCYHTNFPEDFAEQTGTAFFSPLLFALLRWFHNGSSATMIPSESMRAHLSLHGFKNLRLWPLGVNLDLFKRSDATPLPHLEHPVFMYCGRVAPEKNIEEFLAADLPGTKLVIGDGPDRKRLEGKYPSARFVGYRRGQDLVDYISLADVFVMPSRTETFGLVIIEALACGIPVAAHLVVGPQDILTDGVDGIMREDIAEAARLALQLDRSKCRPSAERFSWEHSADAFLVALEWLR
jgi:glycosyltransferase involved in cell wall biosynthesis